MSPHKLLFCYHLPTRGRAGVKLGDADTSQTYLQFFMLHACLLSNATCFLCIFFFFRLISLTNLLTRCLIRPFCITILYDNSPSFIYMFLAILYDQDYDGSMSPKKLFYFYRLPTRGRAGIKLGDADTLQMYL